MNQNKTKVYFWTPVWNFFTSVKLSVVVLLSLAFTSIIGTFIPQNATSEWYHAKFGEKLYHMFQFFDIFDMYHSWWFKFLLLMLTINIVICSINRLKSTWKIIFVKPPKFNRTRLKKLPKPQEFTVHSSAENLIGPYENILAKAYGIHQTDKDDDGLYLYTEKGRWTRLGVYLVHLSILLLIAGSLLGSIFGFEGFVNIPEGESTDSINLRNSNKTVHLDFTVRCDDFDVSFYDTGAPKMYRSSLSVFENNNTVVQKDIIVNDPLRYKGINFFQSSYGTGQPKDVYVQLFNRKTGKVFNKKTAIGQKFELPDGQGNFFLKEFHPSYHFKGHNMGKAFTGILYSDKEETIDVIIPFPFPELDPENPMSVKMLDMYQTQRSSMDLSKKIPITFTSAKTGMQYLKEVGIKKRVKLPENLGSFLLTGAVDSFQYMGQKFAEKAFTGKLTPVKGETTDIIIPLRYPGFDKMRGGDVFLSVSDLNKDKKTSDFVVSVTDYSGAYYTGLQVTKDPGVPVVYAGFIFMIIGCYITFFMSHQTLCVQLKKDNNKTKVIIRGTSNKNKLGMENQVKRLAKRLEKIGG